MGISTASRAALGALLALSLSGCNGTSLTPGNHPAPLLVQVENISVARPQSGLQPAAVVYEYVTEGGISRFSALYASAPSGRVGPIRSARLVTIALARIYGAVLVYSGGSEYINGQIRSAGIPHVDENSANGDLFRDNTRSAPHNLYSDGSHLSDIASRANAAGVSWSLWQRTPATSVNGGKPMARVTVPVSDNETPTFVYDTAASGWKRIERDTGDFIDANTRAPVMISTLIVQQVNIKPTSEVVDVNGEVGVDHEITGSGNAQVFTAGREFDATWTQGPTGPPTFSSSGNVQLPIAPGLVWICLVATGSSAT
ncbi:MAG: DUF3048 domain-containing protein [Chloroflexi bacterium]|nr:MAG: DUF3048 domain-containing protein [Chloroflexota bacterium]